MLRNLFMGLLLANLLLFTWSRWIMAPDVADLASPGEQSEAQLVLIERTDRPHANGTGSAPDGTRCFRIGPFASAQAAAVVGDRLSSRGLPVERTSESGQIWVGHWVQLPDLASIETAREAVKKLVSGGIRDAYISSREPTIDISLGVFRGRRGADDVIRLARALGYAAEATDRFRDGIEYWVEVSTSADQPPDSADLRIGEAQIIRIEERGCAPSVAGSASNHDHGADADVSLESPVRETISSESTPLPE